MGDITFMGIFCLLKIKLTHKPSLATNSCLLFEPQSSFTGVPFVLLEFSGKTRRARLEKYGVILVY